ncbi:MAG: hypothetical protein LBG61_07655 [Burkholderiales bacterium]|jgi:hypothetical protein|nr:hypothetical protein [Burkholderiales bacterium]
MLCKYAGNENYYKAAMEYFFKGSHDDFIEAEPSDEAYEVLEQMVQSNQNAQTALGYLPGPKGFAPGLGSLALQLPRFLIALVNSNPYYGKFCTPQIGGLMKACVELKNNPKFLNNMAVAKKAVSLQYISQLEEILIVNGALGSCPKEE